MKGDLGKRERHTRDLVGKIEVNCQYNYSLLSDKKKSNVLFLIEKRKDHIDT